MERRLARVLVVFVTYLLATVGMGIATAVLAVIADLDVLSVAQWGSWMLLLIFFLPMVSLWVRRCRALGQARFSPWDFSDGIGSIDDCTDRG